jgi:hypothetical protein
LCGSNERASSMKKVDFSTDVAAGVHNSHQRGIKVLIRRSIFSQ